LRHRRSHNLRRPPQTPATGSPFHPQRQSASHPAPLPTSSLPSWSASAHTLPDQSAPAEPLPTPCSSSSQPPAVPLGRFADRTCSATWPAASSAPQETQAAVSLLPSAAALPQPASTFCLVPTSHFLPSCLLSDPHIDQPMPADNRGHIRVRRIHHPRCQLRIIVALNPVKVSLDRFLTRLLLQVSKPELGGTLIDGINRCQCPVKRSTVHHHLQSHHSSTFCVRQNRSGSSACTTLTITRLFPGSEKSSTRSLRSADFFTFLLSLSSLRATSVSSIGPSSDTSP